MAPFFNGVRIDAARYYQMHKGDVLRFGSSTRECAVVSSLFDRFGVVQWLLYQWCAHRWKDRMDASAQADCDN